MKGESGQLTRSPPPRSILTSPGRNFVTVKVITQSGVVGYGDGTLNGRELAAASYLRDHLCPLLIGRDAGRIEDTWQYFAKGAYWRRGPVTMTAIAAIDMALWDIKAKTAGMPLYQLLGGASRDAVRVYCHASGISIPELLDDVRLHLDQGYTAIRIQSGVPGLAQIYGIHAADMAYEPAHPDRRAGRGDVGHRRLPATPADGVRGGPARVRRRADAAA